MKTIREIVEYYVAFPVKKHGLDGYPERPIEEIVKERIDEMTMGELLEAISSAQQEQRERERWEIDGA